MSRTPAQRWQRAMHYLAEEQLAPAQAQLEALEATAPDHVCTQLLAAEMAWRGDRVRASSAFALRAACRAADDPELACDVVTALLRVGETETTRRYLTQPVLVGAASRDCLVRLSDFSLGLGEYADSLAFLDLALATGNDVGLTHFYRGRLLTFLGRINEAQSEYGQSLQSLPTYGEVALQWVTLRAQTLDAYDLPVLEAGLQNVARGTRGHAGFEFARYKVLEDLGRHEEAWLALARGNAVLDARTHAYAQLQNAFLQRACQYYTSHPLRPVAATTTAGPQPIFVLGLPRSGTTVLERLLGNHSQVTAAGELSDFGIQLQWAADCRNIQDDAALQRMATIDLAEVGRRYLDQTQWRARGKPRFVDKQTSNWMVAGLIHAALPGARILHMVREPMDVCFSIFRAMFGDAYAIGNDLETLAVHYKMYRRLMSRWHALAPGAILDVSYAELVQAPEMTMRKVIANCGLAWEPACADLASNTNPVSTLSAVQMREPLQARSSGLWRHYEAPLLGLSRALSDG